MSCFCRISVVLRDYSKMRQQDCDVVTDYGGKEFGVLYDVVIGVNDEVIVVDNTNKCAVVLDCNLTLLSVIGQGSGLENPNAIAISKDGIIAVSDWGSNQVKKYTIQGKLLSVIGTSRGSNDDQFDHPSGLVFSSDKALYIVDRGNSRVLVFQQDDKFSFTFGSKGSDPGQFQYPVRIAIDTDNKVLVSDWHDNHISVFSHTGSFISRITCDSPYAITVTTDGHIINSCDHGTSITIWSPSHQLVHQLGKKGSQQGEFCHIEGVAMNSSGTIYVVEGDNKRLQMI